QLAFRRAGVMVTPGIPAWSFLAMRTLLLALGATAMLAQPVLAASPTGIWEIEMRDSRYNVEMCGEDGKQLCGTLIWLGRGADNAENMPYLNTMMIDHAKPVGPNQWK